MTTRPDRPGISGGLVSVASAGVAGITGYPVTIEVHAALGLPGFTIVGAPDATCRETRDRVRAAIINSGMQWPTTRITVNIAPPRSARRTSSLDLAVAVGILAADGQINRDSIAGYSFISELGLDGTLRGVPAGVSLVEAVTTRRVVVAPSMVTEARLAGRGIVITAPDLRAVADAIGGRRPWSESPLTPGPAPAETPLDDRRLTGPPAVRAAVAVAAAGGHNMLLVGPHAVEPATTAGQLAGLVPDLTDPDALDVSRVYSAAGLPLPVGGLIRRPPLRHPHPTMSTVALLGGGGANIRPGEISLAHNGLLFVDDLTDYPRGVLDSLAYPLRCGVVLITRADTRVNLPARYQLVAAMRPSPCGAPAERCQCSDAARARFAGRLSGRLFDRFDVRVAPGQPGFRSPVPLGGDIASVVERIEIARSRAAERGARTNAELQDFQLEALAPLDNHARSVVDRALSVRRLTGLGVLAVWRVALTLADLHGDGPPLTDEHVGAALALRAPLPPRPAR